MRNFDRVVLVVLALGIWALVLKPTELTAHGDWHSHAGNYAEEDHDHSLSCRISGTAEGYAHNAGPGYVDVDDWGDVKVRCSVY